VPRLVLNYDLRHPDSFGASAGATYATALDQIGWADEHGFAFVAFGEHHQSPDGYLSCPLLFAAAIGGRTKTIRVRVSALLAPLYDPIRLAEEIAVADLCLGGRLDVGFARAFLPHEFRRFGRSPDAGSACTAVPDWPPVAGSPAPLRRGVIGSLQPFEGLRSWIESRRRNRAFGRCSSAGILSTHT